MTQENKNLLLKDICARLPYGVKCKITAIKKDEIKTLFPEQVGVFERNHCKIYPYLRPMSSMAEWEYKEFCKISGLYKKKEGNYFSNHLSELGNSIITEGVMVRTIDWLNAHHFDYRGLIPMGLALEAPEDMYKI